MSAEVAEFWRERHLCTLTTTRPDGTPHVVPVGAVLDGDGYAWVITSRHSRKARNVLAAGADAHVAICQVDGRRWSTVEGIAEVLDESDAVRRAEELYAGRYRVPRVNPDRVAIRIAITRTMGSATR